MMLKALEHLPKQRLRAVLVKHRCDLIHHEDVLLKPVDVFLGCAGHELHDEAASGLDALVGIHKHAQRTGRRHLLTLKQIRGQILGYLAADKLRRADIRLVEPYIAADGQSTVAPDYAADVELAVLPRGEVGCGILDISAHVARRV